ncbi:hypothetical protein T069G_06378 [Trichoderma breve]|uniref:Oxidase ustYa n=1 Tax=Trichoderma breve TaxID=2034170 RepID=A0A9W9E849_9HYPO|nr:hypothetical protein T069G_06378 [Trichoderma breve]KAJ4858111.1 hypothetical protein T069G_06378 [Trichoderma breve]
MPLWLDKTQYTPVSNGDADSSSRESLSFPDTSSFRQNVGRIRFVWIHGVLGVFWIIAFSSLLFLRSRPQADTLSYPDLTSPLYPALSYSETHFTSGFTPDLSAYQGKPNETNNAHWDKLTHPGMVALTEQEHAKLPSKSSLFIDDHTRESDPPLYVGAVEVFHQLHCLDMLRMQAYAHLEHCIDYIRQSMMCRPSLDILPFRTDSEGLLRPVFNGSRTCANFDKVRDWAIKRKAGNLSPQ